MLEAGYPPRRVGSEGPARAKVIALAGEAFPPPPPDFEVAPPIQVGSAPLASTAPGGAGPSAPGAGNPASDGSASGEGPRSGKRKLGWFALASLGVALALLTVAEVAWLHDLPSQPARRVAVVLLPPTPGIVPATGLPADWTAKALGLARDPAVLKAAAAAAGSITPDWLATHLHVTGTCIQTAVPGKPATRGLLVYAAVHGQAEARLPAIAAAWAGAFIAKAEESLGDVRATRQDALLVPIRACD